MNFPLRFHAYKSRPRRILFLPLLFLLAIATSSGQIANMNTGVNPNAGLEPLYFPGGTLFEKSGRPAGLPFPLLGAQFSFTTPSRQAGFNSPVVGINVRMEFNAASIPGLWQKEVTSRVQDTGGCSQQSVHSFRAEAGQDGQIHGYFHVKYVNRWCVGSATGDNFTVETDVWNDFQLKVSEKGQKLTLEMTGHASDNVSKLARDAAQFVGNVLSIFPLTNSMFLGLDGKIRDGLKAEQDALRAASASRTVRATGVPDINLEGVNLDWVYDEAHFTNGPGVMRMVVGLKTSDENPVSLEMAKTIRGLLSDQLSTVPSRGRR